MMHRAAMLAVALCLAACQAAAPEKPDWGQWIAQVEAMDAASLAAAQADALRQFAADPADDNRLRAAYTLSRSAYSTVLLEQAREILEAVPADSDVAAYCNLLETEIRLRMILQIAQQRLTEEQLEGERLQARSGELERRIEGLQSQVQDLQVQIETLKAIEEDMVESQQQTDDAQQ